MTDAMVKHEPQVGIIHSMDDAERAARAMVASGFFADSKQASQAVVKILAGQELGFGPFASMTGVNIIQNKPVLAANLMAAAVKRQGKYNYRVISLTDTGCELAFFEGSQEVGRSAFTKADAEKAQLLNKDNWRKYPRNMFFARALSNGQKWYAPDVFNGATVYTPDELGARVDEEGNAVIDVVPVSEQGPSQENEQANKEENAASELQAELESPDTTRTLPQEQRTDKTIARPLTPSTLRTMLATKASKKTGDANSAQLGLMDGMMNLVFAPDPMSDKIRHSCLKYLWGVTSSKELTGPQVKATLDWLKPVKDSGGAYSPDTMAATELKSVWTAAQVEAGQGTLI